MRGTWLVALALAVLALLGGLWVALDDGGGIALAADGALAPALADRAELERAGGDANAPASARRESERRALQVAEQPTALAAGAEPFAPEGVHGRVVDEAGAPVEGARVFAAARRGWMATPLDLEPLSFSFAVTHETGTDAAGRWAFAADALETGPLRVVVRRTGFVPARLDDWTVPKERPCAMPEVVLRAGARLEGRVVDEGDAPVAGARVLLVPPAAGTGGARVLVPGRGVPLATTGADGRFATDELEPGPWTLLVDADGRVPARVEGRASATEPARARVVLRTGLAIEGRVTGLAGDALAGLEVVARRTDAELEVEPPPGFEDAEDARPRRAAPGPDGAFRVGGLLPAARYRLTAVRSAEPAPGSSPTAIKVRRLPEEGALVALAGARGVELALGAPARLVAQVVDAATGEPLEELTVFTREGVVRDAAGAPRTSWPGGALECADLDAGADRGTTELLVRARGYADLEAGPFTVRPGEEHDAGLLRLEPAVPLVVRVVDAASGAPVVNARVALAPKEPGEATRFVREVPEDAVDDATARVRLARTDAEGLARLDAPAGAAVHVLAGAPDYRPAEPELVVLSAAPDPAAPARRVELELSRGGRVVVRVTDPDGAPVEGERVAHRRPGQQRAGNVFGPGGPRTDARGEVRFEGLEPGEHAFGFASAAVAGRIDPGGADDSWTRVPVSAGGAHELELVTARRGGLRGLVREAGQPLAGARVRLLPEEESAAGARMTSMVWGQPDPRAGETGADGRFALSGVEVGPYRLFVTHAEREMPEEVPVLVDPTVPEVTVDLAVSVVEGRVTTLEGTPLAGARVAVREAKSRVSRHVLQPTEVTLREDEEGGVSFDTRSGREPGAVTGDDGRYALRGVRADVPLVVTASGEAIRSTSTEPFEVARDEVVRGVDLAVPLAGSILVRLVGDGGGWYRVRATRMRPEGAEGDAAAAPVRTSSRETYVYGARREARLEGLEAGRWRISVGAWDPGAEGERELAGPELEVAEGRTTEYELRVP